MSDVPEMVHNQGFDNIEIVGQKIKLRPLSAADVDPA
jgi:hypothetical protein